MRGSYVKSIERINDFASTLCPSQIVVHEPHASGRPVGEAVPNDRLFHFIPREQARSDGGYVSFSNDTIDGWHYYIQDYMGNNRMVVNSNGTVEQVTHYYPYGGVIGDISTNENVQNYKFEGKELDRTFGLDYYDIHARQYFAMMPMWDRIDPLAEKNPQFSPYSFCKGNPVIFGDYDGMKPSKKEGGALVNHIYNANVGDKVGEWKCNEIIVNKSNGLRYGIYSRKMKNGEMEFALVFEGTNDTDGKYNDWNTDIRQAKGEMDKWQISESGLMEKTQYGEAVEASVAFKETYKGQEVTILGHSLGGGLAITGSLATGIQCMTYNPAGLHINTLRNLGLSSSNNKITNYVNIGDGVSLINVALPKITVPGNTFYNWNANSIIFGYSILGLYLNHKAINFK